MYITKQQQTHIHMGNKLMVTSGRGKEEGQDRGRDPQVQTTMYKQATRIYFIKEEDYG